jgi:microcystin-dependent protein
MADPFVAEIRIFPFNFAPRGWAACNGQFLPISQNTALFSLLGTTYGGDGKFDFALPSLQGRAPMQHGQGPGLSLRDLGEYGGSETVTILESEVPAHSHTLTSGGDADTASPTDAAWTAATAVPNQALYGEATAAPGVMADAFSSNGAQPHNNMQPYLTMNFCIALTGIFPPRS